MEKMSKLKKLRNAADLSQTELANRLGLSRNAIAKWESGESSPNEDNLERLAIIYRVPVSELEGNSAFDGKQNVDLLGGSLMLIKELDLKVSAGGGAIIDSEELKASWPFPKSYAKEVLGLQQGNASIVEVMGDSMEPTLYAGDRIIVNQLSTNPSQPGVFVIFDGGETVVKRIEKIPNGDGGQVKLISDNPLHGDYVVDAEAVKIVGRVACIIRKV